MNNDLISRSALKKAINDFYDNHFKGLVPNELITYAKAVDNAIDNAPTAEERPQGEWIIDGHHICCNRCNEYICDTDREGNKIPDSFCPNCGADMRKGGQP